VYGDDGGQHGDTEEKGRMFSLLQGWYFGTLRGGFVRSLRTSPYFPMVVLVNQPTLDAPRGT